MLSVYIDPKFGEFKKIVFTAIEQLLEIAGYKVISKESIEHSDLAYVTNNPMDKSHIPCAGVEAWESQRHSSPAQWHGYTVPSQAVFGDGSKPKMLDLPLCMHYFLMGFHESPQTDEKPGVPGEKIAIWGVLKRPIINTLAQMMAEIVHNLPSRETAKKPWPKGKKWAFCITHDCDRPFLYQPLNYLKDAYFHLRQVDYRPAALSLIKSFYSSIFKLLKKDPRYSSWEKLMSYEKQMNLRSAIYIGVWNRFKPNSTQNDFGYNHDDKRIKKLVEHLKNDGWEIGLHFSTTAWKNPQQFNVESNLFEQAFDLKPLGGRGHYWSLDPTKPESTFIKMSTIGNLTYDTSLGMNKECGFRRGIAYPYRPYDPDTGQYTNIWEIPPTIMDVSLLEQSQYCTKEEAFKQLIRNVVESNGLLVLDWHTDTLAAPYISVGSFLMKEIRTLREDSSCWIATPREIIEWCTYSRWETN